MNGVRVFYFDGSYEDYDPIEEHKVTWFKDQVHIENQAGYKYEINRHKVKEIAPYKLTDERADNGCYIRIFKRKEHIKMVSDMYEA